MERVDGFDTTIPGLEDRNLTWKKPAVRGALQRPEKESSVQGRGQQYAPWRTSACPEGSADPADLRLAADLRRAGRTAALLPHDLVTCSTGIIPAVTRPVPADRRPWLGRQGRKGLFTERVLHNPDFNRNEHTRNTGRLKLLAGLTLVHLNSLGAGKGGCGPELGGKDSPVSPSWGRRLASVVLTSLVSALVREVSIAEERPRPCVLTMLARPGC